MSMSARDRRAFVVGLLVIAAAFVAFRGIPAWRRWVTASREDAMTTRAELTVARANAASEHSIRDSLDALNKRFVALGRLLVDGDTPASATGSMASLVSNAAMSNSVRLGAIQVAVDSNPRRAFTRITLRGQATGDITGVAGMLATLESGPTLTVVRELSISQMDPNGAPDRPETLQISFVVQSLALLRPKS